MGYPYAELVAPAILLDHPGITREEFADRLDQTHSSPLTEFKAEDPWSSHKPLKPNEARGLQRLAQELRLSIHPQMEEPRPDPNGVNLKLPHYGFDDQGKGRIVIQYYTNILGDEQYFELETDQQIEAESCSEDPYSTDALFIKEILEARAGEPFNKYVVRAVPVQREAHRDYFASYDQMYQQWGFRFKPEYYYDWDQKDGHFDVPFNGRSFLWKQEEGKYSLDPHTFNMIPERLKVIQGYGYTDLILTAEAVKFEAWKLLSRRGKDHFRAFLGDFPQAIPRYVDAIRDSHLSLSARDQGLSTYDLLRLRLEPHPNPLDPTLLRRFGVISGDETALPTFSK